LGDLLVGSRLMTGLPAFWRRRVEPSSAATEVRRRLGRREADFVDLVTWGVYQQPGSPYRALLALAGCEPGDLARLVRLEGLEGALLQLYRQGVYLTAEELKGRQPVVRGSATLMAGLAHLHNPRLAAHLGLSSSGSQGASASGAVDLRSVADQTQNFCLVLAARGDHGWRKALWAVPGSAAMVRMLDLSAIGPGPARWFTQIAPDAAGLHPRYRWSVRLLRWGSLLAGRPLPEPVYVPLDDPLPVARWLSAVLRNRQTPLLWTHASPGVRICRAALEAGIDLTGAQLSIGGEPSTPARMAAIRQSGAQAVSHYATMECGLIAYGCLSPSTPDELHLMSDLHAVIQPDREAGGSGLAADTVLVSSLRPTTRFVLINASLGDRAELFRRSCGCALEQQGWTTHLQTVRSFAKVTAGGMTFLDNDIIRVLEEVLPARFGGGPTDYQLVEEEAEADGQPRLRLLVRPSVGPFDPAAMAEAFMEAIGGGSGAERVMSLLWRQTDWLRVERRAPWSTDGGKVLHLWRQRATAAVST
jgi:hypothetical protein